MGRSAVVRQSSIMISDNDEPFLLRPRDVERLLQLGRTKVGDLLRSGRIPSIKCGRSVRVYRRDLIAWIERQREQP
jgi:excisionase family DNA binding protein